MLKLITSQNAEYFELSGERHPYKQGPLGVIREGAYADILLVDGNPLDDVSILGDDGKNIPLIMKDGKIYKNTLLVTF
jgi:imidazolonepropionase-like amidohydrolase